MNKIQLSQYDLDTCGCLFETPMGQLEIQVVLGNDGTPVVYIDTPDWDDGPYGPELRIWLNDDTVFEGVALPTISRD